jgi:hypothetical protein
MGKLPQLLIEQYTDERASGDAQQSDPPQNGSATIQSLLKTLGLGAPGTEHSVRTGYLLDEHPTGWRKDAVTGLAMLDCSMSCSDEAAVRDGFICREQGEVIGIDSDDAGGLVRSSLSRLSSVVTTRTTHSPFVANSGDNSSVAVHLVVLQHGFLGCGADMALLKNAIRMELPSHVKVFIPTSNEGKEGDSIAQMGARLAVELLDFCRTAAPSLLELNGQAKVSFIGHSLGGVVIRWALQVQLETTPHPTPTTTILSNPPFFLLYRSQRSFHCCGMCMRSYLSRRLTWGRCFRSPNWCLWACALSFNSRNTSPSRCSLLVYRSILGAQGDDCSAWVLHVLLHCRSWF